MCKVLWGVSVLVGRRGQLWSFTLSHFIRKASEVTHPLKALGTSIVVPVSKSPFFTGTHLNWHTQILNKKLCPDATRKGNDDCSIPLKSLPASPHCHHVQATIISFWVSAPAT